MEMKIEFSFQRNIFLCHNLKDDYKWSFELCSS